MTTWVLIVFAYANMFADADDSVALTNVPGFVTQQQCIDAGAQVTKMAGGHKDIKYSCVKLGR